MYPCQLPFQQATLLMLYLHPLQETKNPSPKKKKPKEKDAAIILQISF